MTMTWFKLHHEIIDDIKIRRFSAQEKWAWIVLLSLASKSSDRGKITADNEDLADYCEFNSTQDWLYYRDKLIIKGMLEINSTGGLSVVHWDDRQAKKPSDDPTRVKERVARSRAKRKSETASQSQEDVTRYKAIQAECNADVSLQTRSDQTRSEEIRSEDLFLRAQEKKIKAPCKIEISLPEEKKEVIALENNPEDQDPTPIVPAPPLRNFPDPQGDRFRDGGKRDKQVSIWIGNDDFRNYLLPIVVQYDAYKKNGLAGVNKFIRVANGFDERGNNRYAETKDYWDQFLEKQARSQEQTTTPIAAQEDDLTTYTVPSFVKDFAKSRKAS